MYGIKEEITVLMFGRSGVGKTSTLSAIYQQIRNSEMFNLNNDIELFTDSTTRNRLDSKINDLNSSIQSDINDSVNLTGGIEGSSGKDYFKFYLSKDEEVKNEYIDVNFIDIPGGWLQDESKRGEIKELIREADVLLIPIDTPPMMERDGTYNEMFNGTERMNQMFRDFKNIFKECQKLIVFVPVKAEKYLNNNLNIKDKFLETNKNILDFFRDFHNIVVALTPIQTIGKDVQFAYIKDYNDSVNFVYSKNTAIARYQPINTEQPLIYILLFSIAKSMRSRGTFTGWIGKTFSLDEQIKKLYRSLDRNAKKEGEFAVLQNSENLDLEV